MKVFLDCNGWLSATIFAGLCAELVVQCTERGGLLSSDLVRTEVHEVLRPEFPTASQATALFDNIWAFAEKVPEAAEPVDDNDRRLVKTAAAAGASLFVTGDKRVLGWKPLAHAHGSGALHMVSPREAWGLIQQQVRPAR